MKKLLEAINRGILRGLHEQNMELLSDLDDNSISQLDSLQTKTVNTMRNAKDIIIIKKFIKGIQQCRNSQYLLNPIRLDDNIKNEINNPDNFEKYKAIIRPVSNRDFKELISVGVELLGIDGNFNWIDTSEITSMAELFITDFNGHIELWDVSNVTNMSLMFWRAYNFNQPIGNWDVSNVKNMAGMFAHTKKFNQDIGRWDVSNVTSMDSMFYYAEAFNQDISKWDVKNCKKNDFMFTGSKVVHNNRPKFIDE